MATGVNWMLGDFSYLGVILLSIIFLVIYISFYTMCMNCFRQSAETSQHSQKKEIPSSTSPTEEPEGRMSPYIQDGPEGSMSPYIQEGPEGSMSPYIQEGPEGSMSPYIQEGPEARMSPYIQEGPGDRNSPGRPSDSEHDLRYLPQNHAPRVPARPLHRRYTTQHNPQTKAYSHNRAESEGVPKEIISRLVHSSMFSFESPDSVYMAAPDIQPHPFNFGPPRVPVEHVLPSAAAWQPKTDTNHHVKPGTEDFNADNLLTDHIYSLPNLDPGEEHPYECIGMQVKVAESPLSSCDEAAEDQMMGEDLYQVIKKPVYTSPTPLTVPDNTLAEEPASIVTRLPDTPDSRQLSDTDVYAAVNRNYKNQKIKEIPFPIDTTVLEEDDIAEEVPPPVPEKLFV